jgi:hypothetical protein
MKYDTASDTEQERHHMAQVSRSKVYDVAVHELWRLVGDFYAPQTWMEGIASVQRHEDRGAREVTLKGADHNLVETLLEEGALFQRYEFSDPGPIPVQNYTSDFRAEPLTATTSRLSWSAAFEARGVTEEQATAQMTDWFDAALTRVGELLAA